MQSLQPKVEKMEAAWARLHTITGAETPEEVIAYFEGDHTCHVFLYQHDDPEPPSFTKAAGQMPPVQLHMPVLKTAAKPQIPPDASYVVGDRARTGIPAPVLLGLKKADKRRP